jgi:hypothetical protein
MVRLAHDEFSTPLKYRAGTISTPFRKIFAIICLSPVFPVPSFSENYIVLFEADGHVAGAAGSSGQTTAKVYQKKVTGTDKASPTVSVSVP